MSPDRLNKRLNALEAGQKDRKGYVVFLSRVGETHEEAEARMALECPDGVDVVVWFRPGDDRI